MSNLSEERLAMAQTVLRPMPSFRTHRPKLTIEQQLDQSIDYLEKHNEEVRSQILTTSLTSLPTHSPSAPLPTTTPEENRAIIASLATLHDPKNPPPPYQPPSHRPPPPPSSEEEPKSAASIARQTIQRLEVFEEQARRTLMPFYLERERRRKEKEPRALEVPKEFGAGWAGAVGNVGGPGGIVGADIQSSAVGGEGERRESGGGMYDRARDPRLRRD
ncbi:MAG: hypothetical protein Q9166_004860 [cf. Caloplaca sp. 2 TL-2023]